MQGITRGHPARKANVMPQRRGVAIPPCGPSRRDEQGGVIVELIGPAIALLALMGVAALIRRYRWRRRRDMDIHSLAAMEARRMEVANRFAQAREEWM